MTRKQRLNLKNKYKRLTWLSLGMILLFALNIVLLCTIKWRPEAMSDPTQTSDLLLAMFVCIVLFIPIMLALSFNVRSMWTQRALYAERRRINTERNKLYVRRVFENVQKGDFDTAIDIHNDLVFGDVKLVTRGVLIGSLYYMGTEKDKEKAIRNMKGIVEEEM